VTASKPLYGSRSTLKSGWSSMVPRTLPTPYWWPSESMMTAREKVIFPVDSAPVYVGQCYQ
jgi:hypothetical protein